MSVELRLLKDAVTGQPFVPVTHWDAVSNKPNIDGSLYSINASLYALDASIKNIINDSSINVSETWSSLKIDNEILAVKVMPYLKFTANTAGSTIALYNKGENAPDIKYSRDGVNWTQWDYSTIALTNVGDYIYMKGDNSQGISMRFNKCSQFVMTGSIAGSGNIMSLIDNGACQTLTIPGTQCYRNMFYDCSSLTSAPELPATALASSCYTLMFYGCTSLTIAPELPATTLASGCYTLMFLGCTSLTIAPKLPATTLASSCYLEMFLGCTSLTIAPELPATTLASSCYSYMFGGCASLTIAPELPATTLASSCYMRMFVGCSKLSYIKCLATTGFNENNSTSNWVSGVASTGTFIKDANTTWPTGDNGIPDGWNYINLSDKQIYENGHIYDSSVNSIAEGVLNGSIGNIIVNQCVASGINSHAEGFGTAASNVGSHAEGYGTNAVGHYSHAEGWHSIAFGENSHTEGNITTTQNYVEHAQGLYNNSHKTASNAAFFWKGDGNHTLHSIGIGNANNARKNAVEVMQNGEAYLYGVGNYDGVHIKGETGAPSGLQTLQEEVNGKQNMLTPWTNIDITNNMIAARGYEYDVDYESITTGYDCRAEGTHSHAEGELCVTAGIASHAEGSGTNASGECSHAEGVGTKTTNINEHAQGRYNVTHSADVYDTQHEGNTIVSVGIGPDDDNRKNAFEIMQNGDIYLYGLGYYDGTATKYDDSNIMTLQDILKKIADHIGADIGALW